MSVRVYHDFGTAKKNQAVKIARMEVQGPATFSCHNKSPTVHAAVSIEDETTGVTIKADQDTVVASEATGYTGNGSTPGFTGQNLDHLPVVPGTIVLHPATTGVDIADDLRDGNFYSVDVDHALCGKIDYFTGAMVLAYPTGKYPNGAISAKYTYQDTVLNPEGRKNYNVANSGPSRVLVAKAACDDADGCYIDVDGIATWA